MSGINFSQFDNTVKVGEKYEDEVLSWIRKFYPTAYKPVNKVKECDIIVPKENMVLIECKDDLMSETTGNFFIEGECNGNPSGINATWSDYWIQGSKANHYMIKTEALKALVKNYTLRKVKNDTENIDIKGYIIPIDVIEKISTKVVKR